MSTKKPICRNVGRRWPIGLRKADEQQAKQVACVPANNCVCYTPTEFAGIQPELVTSTQLRSAPPKSP